jgi:hypothetical protein
MAGFECRLRRGNGRRAAKPRIWRPSTATHVVPTQRLNWFTACGALTREGVDVPRGPRRLWCLRTGRSLPWPPVVAVERDVAYIGTLCRLRILYPRPRVGFPR